MFATALHKWFCQSAICPPTEVPFSVVGVWDNKKKLLLLALLDSGEGDRRRVM